MLMIVLFSIMFLMSIQPVMMVVSLIIITFLYSVYIYKMMESYWFSYILILVMLSGVLVIFTYMISLMPNESFEMYNMIFIIISLLFMFKMVFINSKLDLSYVSLNLWMSYISIFNLFLISFLFTLMVVVVWLGCLNEGAMRVLYMCAWLKD